MKENKIFQPEQITVRRSQIHFAAYNPRIIDEEARKMLKKNMQRIGLLGGVVWNRATGNLVSGHQRVSIMDSVNRYNPETGDNDYEFRVEAVDLDEKTEKEQNLFMNNRNVQGRFDDDLLRSMLDGIDYGAAGFGEFDLLTLGIGTVDDVGVSNIDLEDIYGEDNASKGENWDKDDVIKDNVELAIHDDITQGGGENHKIDRTVDFHNDTAENQIARHNEISKIKERIAAQNDESKDGGCLSYFVVSFQNPTQKSNFLEQYGFDPLAKYINGEEFAKKIEFGDE